MGEGAAILLLTAILLGVSFFLAYAGVLALSVGTLKAMGVVFLVCLGGFLLDLARTVRRLGGDDDAPGAWSPRDVRIGTGVILAFVAACALMIPYVITY